MGTPIAQADCTKQAADPASAQRALAEAAPGDRVCLSGNVGRVEVRRSGTPTQPISVLGGGKVVTEGVTVEADNVLIDGVNADKPKAPGMLLRGNNITVQNSAIVSPREGDGDGIRFFGTNIRILHNLVRNTVGTKERHADALQTFATSEQYPASRDILIEANRFEDIANICLIAEGPNSEAGDGSGEGTTTNIVFRNNFCQNGAGQALLFDDVSNVTVQDNEIVGDVENGIILKNKSTGARVGGNKIAPHIESEIWVDDSSKSGYQGPRG
ncbi:right-handed parallel beta-helix repeat-containing protein [Pseudonocardia acaciae]|uniref:right-handed parallel beta-helix repeat-containing protein n=1 Tax=Pseudonocardia acaciae TaxID=551276 RepID=UPI0006876AE1|nr:right-handed parallel beta-helix repeat-containing protein [Pseudonocardia acaciae]